MLCENAEPFLQTEPVIDHQYFKRALIGWMLWPVKSVAYDIDATLLEITGHIVQY